MIKILSLGSGALSCYYSGKLQSAGANITMLCRSDYQEIKKNGINVTSIDGNFYYRPDKVIASSNEIGNDFPDYICIFYKSLPSIPLIDILKPAVGPNTTILLVQNGFELEKPIAEAFPNNEILGGLAFICCERTSSGHVTHHDLGGIKIGCHSNKISDKALALQKLFIAGNVQCTLLENLRYARWEKLVWNVAFNPLSAILGGVTTNFMLADPRNAKLCKDLMQEVATLAKADGNALPDDIVEFHYNRTLKMVPYKTSMCLDFENKREMEVEAILGNIVQLASKINISIPNIEVIYTLLKQINKHIINLNV